MRAISSNEKRTVEIHTFEIVDGRKDKEGGLIGGIPIDGHMTWQPD